MSLKKKIQKLYQAGIPVPIIVKATGFSQSYIYKLCKGLKKRESNNGKLLRCHHASIREFINVDYAHCLTSEDRMFLNVFNYLFFAGELENSLRKDAITYANQDLRISLQ